MKKKEKGTSEPIDPVGMWLNLYEGFIYRKSEEILKQILDLNLKFCQVPQNKFWVSNSKFIVVVSTSIMKKKVYLNYLS